MNPLDQRSSDSRFTFLLPPQKPGEIGRLAHYRVLKILGEGGMGVVFLAEDVRLNRTVALKTMKPDIAADPRLRQRFLREARAAAKVEDDHIVPIYDLGEERGVPWLAMPLLKGQSLDEMLKRLKVLKTAQAIRLGTQVAKGLAAAHAAGLIHRDIKPANIWVEPEGGGRARLLDFGLARDQSPQREQGDEHLTHTGAVVGTPAFMAPEQARGAPLDARADLFSLGCVLYRAVTGRLPFRGQGTMGTLVALATETPPAPHEVNPDVPQPLSALIMNLLAKDRSARPPSASVVASALQALQETSTTTALIAKPVALPAAPQKEADLWADLTEVDQKPATAAPPIPRRPLLIAAAVLLVLVAGIVVIIKNNKGEEVARVVVPDGGTVETKKVGDSAKAKSDSAKDDPDRRAAEWVLSLGGKVLVNYELKKWITELPKERFGLSAVDLSDNRKVTDAGLANLKQCGGLWMLNLSGAAITDAGLVHVKELPTARTMSELYISNTPITDTGLAHLKECRGLRQLQISSTRVSDSGLTHLGDMNALRRLTLHRTKVTEAGVKKLSAALPLCKIEWDGGAIEPPGYADRAAAEWVLGIGGRISIRQGQAISEIKDAKDLPGAPIELVGVDFVEFVAGNFVGNQNIDDAGLVQLKGLKDLQNLNLSHTRVSDAGLEHLEGLNNLTFLGLDNCPPVSDAGLARLIKTLPNLSALYLGGTQVSDAGLVHLKELTKLTVLTLQSTQVSDTGLEHLKGLNNLTDLQLYGCAKVSDAGLEYLKGLNKLQDLKLSYTRVSDAGLVHLKGLTNLTRLELANTRVSDAGLERLKGLTKMGHLGLVNTQVSDAGLQHLKGMTSLSNLGLGLTHVSDAGLKQLTDLKNLTQLDLTGTQVTAEGVATLKKALPKCNIVTGPAAK